MYLHICVYKYIYIRATETNWDDTFGRKKAWFTQVYSHNTFTIPLNTYRIKHVYIQGRAGGFRNEGTPLPYLGEEDAPPGGFDTASPCRRPGSSSGGGAVGPPTPAPGPHPPRLLLVVVLVVVLVVELVVDLKKTL